jgi:hypothetical protein
MKIAIAPNAFKGSLTAAQAAASILDRGNHDRASIISPMLAALHLDNETGRLLATLVIYLCSLFML